MSKLFASVAALSFFKDNDRANEALHQLEEIDESFAPLSEEAILKSVPKIYLAKARILL